MLAITKFKMKVKIKKQLISFFLRGTHLPGSVIMVIVKEWSPLESYIFIVKE